MNYLSVENLAKRFADKVLFEDVSFGLDQGQKTAVVGINGSGKTTLFKILMGLESADTGTFRFSKKIKVRMLEQEPKLTEHFDILDYVLSGDDELSQTVLRYERALENNDVDKISDLIKRMDELHAWDFESQAKQILGKLGIQDLSIPVDDLSGGQQKRVALAKVLIEKPDLLLLDEPTNHLDLEVIEWLEQYLAKQKMSLLLVTHDRYFLEAVTNDILEISNGTTFRYKGSYSYFLEKKLERQQNEERVIEKAKNLMRKELEWIRRMPKARGTKAKYRIDAFGELEKTAKRKIETQELEIALSGKRLGKKIMEIEKISKGFGEKLLFEDFSYTFKKADRIGIVGKNGSGKTTLLKVITGQLSPDSGQLNIGETVTFGYYTQDSLEYKSQSKVIDEIKNIAEFIELSDGSAISASQLLNQFNFSPEKQYDFVAKLSGGEKRRLQLLKVLMANPNFLILDEPTNDLDLVTLNTLEDYLENFGGVLVIVSHDRYFIDRLVDHLFVVDEGTLIRDFSGNFTDYRNEKTPQPNTKEKNTTPPTKAKEPTTNKLTYNEQREFDSLEAAIADLEKEKAILNKKLLEPNVDYAALTKLGQELEDIEAKIAVNEDRWLELSERVDAS